MKCECCLQEREELFKDHRAMAPPLTTEEDAAVVALSNEEGGYVHDNIQYHGDGTPFTDGERQLMFQEQLACTVGSVLLCSECYNLDYPEYWEKWGEAHGWEKNSEDQGLPPAGG